MSKRERQERFLLALFQYKTMAEMNERDWCVADVLEAMLAWELHHREGDITDNRICLRLKSTGEPLGNLYTTEFVHKPTYVGRKV